jgi:Subtilase family
VQRSFLILFAIPLFSQAPDSGVKYVQAAHEAVLKGPAGKRAFEDFSRSLPKAGDFYIVEGDLRMTEQQLRVYVDSKAGGKPLSNSVELLLAMRTDGSSDFYENVDRRTLTYAIEKSGFTSAHYQIVRDKLAQAALDWEKACEECQIHYVYQSEFDGGGGDVSFRVRGTEFGGVHLAVSFFPSTAPALKNIDIDPAAFNPEAPDLAGVLRHELGHTLGYRHEHIQGIAGCASEQGKWIPLTPYDPKSVMHYFCGGGGNIKLELSSTDIEAHRKLYGNAMALAGPGRADMPANLVVDYEGGLVANDVVDVLEILRRRKLLPVKSVKLQPGDSVPGVYTRLLSLPGTPGELNQLADRINAGRSIGTGRVAGPHISDELLHPTNSVWLPDVTLVPQAISQKFDSRVESDRIRLASLQRSSQPLFLDQPQKIGDTLTRLDLRGYRLTLPLDSLVSPDAVEAAAQEIRSLKRRNITVMVGRPASPGVESPPYRSEKEPREWWSSPEPGPNDRATLAAMIGLGPLPPVASCATAAPRLVLVDEPVFNHPDLGDAVEGAVGQRIVRTATGAQLRGTFRRETDHGTHLAGIVAGQSSGYGLLGVEPGAKLLSRNWDVLRNDVVQFRDELQRLDSLSVPAMYLFANTWKSDVAITRRLDYLKNLWVAAAGQTESGAEPERELTRSDGNFPADLADRPYVIVVTACEDCGAAMPRLRRSANYSTDGYVHIAAPGDAIPSTISGGLYGQASGTSQAAAFVAGVISAQMRSYCERDQFPLDRSDRVKEWLQITSRPNLWSSDGRTLMPFGVLDGKAAMLDPRYSYRLISKGGETVYERIDQLKWCRESIELKDDFGDRLDLVNVDDIRRIVKQGDRWFIYLVRGEAPNQRVKRIGPGVLSDPKPVLATSAGVYNLSQITDVITGNSRPPVGGCSVQ